jgi:hypothetical protein
MLLFRVLAAHAQAMCGRLNADGMARSAIFDAFVHFSGTMLSNMVRHFGAPLAELIN